MIISTTILYCDGEDGDRKCPNRLLNNNVLQPLIEAIDHGWKMENPTETSGERSETKHYCPECVKRRNRQAVARFRKTRSPRIHKSLERE